MRQQVGLGQHDEVCPRNITGYLSGLSSPSVTESATTFSALAQVVDRRADEVADVLDERGCRGLPGRVVQRLVHHLGVEVARAAGRDAWQPGCPPRAAAAASWSVARSPLTAPQAGRAAERARGRLEQRRLARTGRAHQVDREHAVLRRNARGCAAPRDRCRRASARELQPATIFGSPHPQVWHIRAPPFRFVRRMISSPAIEARRHSAPVAAQDCAASRVRAASAARPSRRDAARLQSSARGADRAARGTCRKPSTAARARRPTARRSARVRRRTRVAPCARASASTRSSSA